MYAIPIDGYGPAYWQDLLTYQVGAELDRKRAAQARMVHARNCRQAKRDFLAQQADLFPLLPNPRNAGFPSAFAPGAFSSSTLANQVEKSVVLGVAGIAGDPQDGAFSTLIAEGHFSCARVVAPHISLTGEISSHETVTAKARRGVSYRNAIGNTWSGRGKKPQWVVDYLSAGGSLDDLHVD